jgi:hypothetical protein
LPATIPHLTRSSLHVACNATISRACRRSKATSPSAASSVHALSATCTSKCQNRVRRAARERKDGNFARLPPPTDRGCPYKIHTVLTDSGIQFRTPGGGASPSPSIREAWPMVNPSGR